MRTKWPAILCVFAHVFFTSLPNLIGLVRILGEPRQSLPQPRYPSLEHHRREVRLQKWSGKYGHADNLYSYAGTYIVCTIYPPHEPNLKKKILAIHH